MLNTGCVVCLPVVITQVSIIHVAIPVKRMFGARNAFMCTILITFSLTTVNLYDLVTIEYFISSCTELDIIQNGQQRWSFWRFKCSYTIMLNVWPACFDDLFSIGNVSNSCHLRVSGVWFLLYSTWVLVGLPHLWKVLDIGHTVQFLFHHLLFHFEVVFSFRCIQCCLIARQYSVIGSNQLPQYDICLKGFASD